MYNDIMNGAMPGKLARKRQEGSLLGYCVAVQYKEDGQIKIPEFLVTRATMYKTNGATLC